MRGRSKSSCWTGTLGYMDLLILGEICTAIPAYLLRRKKSPIDSDSIPLDIGAAYKLIAGLIKIIDKLIIEGEARLVSGQMPDAEELHDYAEENNPLLATDGEACGGTQQMIIKLLNIAIDGLGRSNDDAEVTTSPMLDSPDFARYGMECAAIRMGYLLFRGELEYQALKLQR